MTTMAGLKLVLIEWVDSHAGRGWQTMERIAAASEPLYCRSVGWLLSETKDCKVIVPHIGGEKNGDVIMQGCGDLTIPAKAIVKMTVLTTG
jgi:hypothetical protein